MTTSRHRRRLDGRSKRALWLVAFAAAVCAPLLALPQFRGAAALRDAAIAEHASVTAQARKLLSLRSADTLTTGSTSGAAGPSADLVARLRSVMSEVGIAEPALRDARQAEPVAMRTSGSQGALNAPGGTGGAGGAGGSGASGGGLVRMSGSATIASVSPANAARLLARWRAAEPSWTVRSVALRAAPPSAPPPGTNPRGVAGSGSGIVDLFELELSFEAIAPAPGGGAVSSVQRSTAASAQTMTVMRSPEARP